MSIDVLSDLMSALYTKPWIRFSPYLMGTLTAIYLQKKAEISQVTL